MKAIIFGDPNSIHLYMNIKEIMIRHFDEIQIVAFSAVTNEKYKEFYFNNSIAIHALDFANRNILIRKLLVLFGIIKIKKLGKFDVCFVHFLSGTVCKIVAKCAKKYNKIVSVYWGSDLLRMSTWLKDCQLKLLNKSTFVRVGEKFSVEKFNEIFGHRFDEKIKNLDFLVNENFKNRIEQTEQELRKSFGFDEKKVIVMCGYNGSKCQNHFEIIKALSQCDQEFKNKIQPVFFMTYSDMTTENLEKYKKEIRSELDKLGCDSIVFTRFLSKQEMLEFAKTIDVYLHFITTDSFSGSFMELLASGAYIIKGKWLKYYEFDDCVMLDSDFETLAKDLTNTVSNIKELKSQSKGNYEKVLKIIDNEKFKKEWDNFIINELRQ